MRTLSTPAPDRPPLARIAIKVLLLAAAAIAIPYLVVFALFAISGSATVHARAIAPDGRLEARVVTQGGSMQYPMTTLAIRPPDGWLGPVGDECAVARWSEADAKVADLLRLEWAGPGRLTVAGAAGRLALPPRACGVAIASTR